MTFVSLADASRRLGIDAKTVHRWLQEAQLPLQSHARDARKKGVSEEHLHLLARLHQRSLAPFPEAGGAPVKGLGPELSASLLALPEHLLALQAQIAALQEQVAALTLLLQQDTHPAARAPSASPSRCAKRAKPARRSRPAAKTPAKPIHVIPRVEYGAEGRYVVICPKGGVLPFEPETPEWFAWVKEQSSFRFVGKAGHFTAHHECRVRKKGAWRAHRHIRNHVSIQPLAPNEGLTLAVLEQAAARLQAHLQ